MEDPYTGLLNRARELKLSRDGKDDDGDEKRDDKPSGSVATATATTRACVICTSDSAAGYLAVCCGGFLCEDCISQYPTGSYSHIFQIGKALQPVCAFCNKDVTNPASFLPWVPADKLPVPGPTGGGFTGPDEHAWNFTLYHSCGQAFTVVGWDECDVLADDCAKCHSKSVNLTGTTKGHSYELRDLLKQLAGFHDRASASAFASLATRFPDAWRALRLTALLRAIAAGQQPDLSLWNEEAVGFLRKNAAKILTLL